MKTYTIPKPVLRSIVSERTYQNYKWPGHKHTVGEWLLIMEKCLSDGKRLYVTAHGNELKALNEIRQVIAVGIAALQQHGAPIRKFSTFAFSK